MCLRCVIRFEEAGWLKTPEEKPTNVISLGAVPPLGVVLEIARKGVSEPRELTPAQVRDLARVLMVHYAQMGIR